MPYGKEKTVFSGAWDNKNIYKKQVVNKAVSLGTKEGSPVCCMQDETPGEKKEELQVFILKFAKNIFIIKLDRYVLVSGGPNP